MPVIRNIPLQLIEREVFRRSGVRDNSKLNPEIKRVMLEMLTLVKERDLLQPSIAYEVYAVNEMNLSEVSLKGNLRIGGTMFFTMFSQAKELVVAVCTIGSNLEKQVTDYTKQGNPLRGVLLDGIGSAAVDALVGESCKIVSEKVVTHGDRASSPVNPGMPGFPLAEQGNLLQLAGARRIGVSLTSSGIMVPRKSVSMVIGVGPKMSTWTQAEGCAKCNLSETCPYREHA